MRWWKHLYMGSHAAGSRRRILRGIREDKLLPDVYVITLPASGNHILDICPVSLLRSEERRGSEALILGVAKGYGESRELVRDMIDDMYRLTGAFDWKAYMKLLEDGEGTEETR